MRDSHSRWGEFASERITGHGEIQPTMQCAISTSANYPAGWPCWCSSPQSGSSMGGRCRRRGFSTTRSASSKIAPSRCYGPCGRRRQSWPSAAADRESHVGPATGESVLGGQLPFREARSARLSRGEYLAARLNSLLLYATVWRTLRLPSFGDRFARVAKWLAILVALLWAMHPLLSEAVVYVTQRTELMVALFYLATLVCEPALLDGWLGYPTTNLAGRGDVGLPGWCGVEGSDRLCAADRVAI